MYIGRMASFTIECTCGERYHVDEAQIGRQLHCRRCGNRLDIRPPAGSPSAPPKSPRKARIRRSSRRSEATKQTSSIQPITIPQTRRWRVAAALGWGYLGAALVVAAMLWGLGDRTTIGTLLLFMGRWIFLLPVVLLAPVVAWLRPRHLLPLAAGTAIVLGPVMGFRTGWRRLLPAPAGEQVRVVSFNADGGRLAAQLLPSVLDRWQAQIVAIQECGEELAAVARRVPGWHLHVSRDLCFLSRYPIRDSAVMDRSGLDRIKQSEPDEPGGAGYVVRFLLEGPRGPIRAANLHLETPRKGFEGLMAGDRRRMENNTEIRGIEAKLAREWVTAGTGPLLVLGDFNTPVESAFFRDQWGDLADAFSVAGVGLGVTKHNGWIGARIDHVLASDEWHVDHAFVDDQRLSDHSALIVDLTLRAR
jgi:endonuclease/exonuclease/phosphatase (EEP) superfamily protein YafD